MISICFAERWFRFLSWDVLVEEAKTAENGEKVVAMIEDGATVKTFYREEGVIRLQPENDFMDPIIVQDVVILGRVIGVMRFFK